MGEEARKGCDEDIAPDTQESEGKLVGANQIS